MKTSRVISGVAAILLIGGSSLTAYASSPPAMLAPAGLSVLQIKITGNEFIMLQNNTGADILASELSNYWLYAYNSSNPAAPGTSSTSQQLPAAVLEDGQTILLSNGGSTCGAAIADDLSVSLSDSAGYLSVIHVTFSGGVLNQTIGDSLAWSSSTHGSSLGSASIVVPTTSSEKAGYADYRYQYPGQSYWWQPAVLDSADPCQLNVVVAGAAASVPSPANYLLPSLPPPAQIVSLASSSNASGVSAANRGLRAPQITELLPNPASPQTDADNEFIEFYNSNYVSFNLANFILQTGTTNRHKYTFPAGANLKPQAFTAFSLKGTGLSLSNSGGSVQLLDSAEKSISKTDDYGSAKDGQAWALADGKWYWTTTPTPSAENVINEPGNRSSRTANSNSPQVLGAASTNLGQGGAGGSSGGNNGSAQSMHPGILAGVGALAVGYALYEYRQDLANSLHKLRRYREARTAAGTKSSRRRSAGAKVGSGWRQNDLYQRLSGWLRSFIDRF